MHKKVTAKLKFRKMSNAFKIRKGVRQGGDTISPKLFNAVLQDVFMKLNWEEKSIQIGEFINHFRFADCIMLLASSFKELQEMNHELYKESKTVRLKTNLSKT